MVPVEGADDAGARGLRVLLKCGQGEVAMKLLESLANCNPLLRGRELKPAK